MYLSIWLCRYLCCDSLQAQMEWLASVFIAQVPPMLLPVIGEMSRPGFLPSRREDFNRDQVQQSQQELTGRGKTHSAQ
uniref:ArfGAP with RhoGAP domain, ankyrin repeat and PH domain 2 n=1 Tax=Molossus molossus TaxID=27622 RepID=A0A7J8JR13_MOLMO|nr:ArfGAP with RhoGAP domain, ankyrin repeat and PH domain 2 [Molossus molossus]